MKHPLFLFLFTVFQFTTCLGQNDKPVGKVKLVADFDVFQSVFEQANAGLYKYHTKKKIDSAFIVNRKRITKKTTYRDFYNIVWNVIDFTGSAHNDLKFPDSLENKLYNKKIFFPMPLKYLNGKLYTNLAYQDIPLGSEITSVNNIPVTRFCAETSRYLSTDGYNNTGKLAFLETRHLPFYIYLAYGEHSFFTVHYKLGNAVLKATLESVDHQTAVANYRKRFRPEYEKDNSKEYSFKYIDSINTGRLTINTFAIGGPKSDGHVAYSKFLDSVFTDLKKKNIPNLIVDVRKNGGGHDPNDLLLYSYMTKRSFRENLSAFTIFNTVPLKNYFVEEDTDELKDLEESLKEEHNILRNGKYYQNEKFNPIWNPKPNGFTGKIYLLVSPFVASAGSLFASMVKSDANSVVIGQETLGGYYGHTGHIPVVYKLPHTGLLVSFSIVDLNQDVWEIPDQKYGDGIKPLHTVETTIEDYLGSRDTVLEFTKRLIK